FRPRADYTVGVGPTNLVVGDLDGDGNRDVVVSNRDGGTLSVLPGNGDGTFQLARTIVDRLGVSTPNLGDVNGDGIPDLVYSNGTSVDAISVLLGNGDGFFGPRVDYATGVGPGGVELVDLNNDSHLDFLVAHQGQNRVSVMLNNGKGIF